MSVTPLSLDNIQCNRPAAERSMPSKYVPQMASNAPQRKQSVFVAPSDLSSILTPPPPHLPPPLLNRPMLSPNRSMSSNRSLPSPPKKSSLPKPNAQILEQHISKIISENAAIVETLDPLWSKRYISRNSTPILPNLSSNGLSFVTNPMSPNETTRDRRFSEVHCNQPLSKLQSALLGKSSSHTTSPPIRKYSEFSSHESSQQSVIINAKDSNVNNDNNNNINNNLNFNPNINHLNNSNSSESEHFGSESIVRNLLTTKTTIQVSPPDKSPHPPPLGTHPQNPEGSIIKDLLLKSRDEGRKKSRTEAPSAPVAEQESSMLVYVCTVCNIAFRNKENLEVHQIHYCKGNDDMSVSRPSKHKMEDLVQRKVSVMARPGYGSPVKHYQHQKQSLVQPFQQQPHQKVSTAPTPPVGNILKQQLLAPNQGPPLKKRKISEPVFRSNTNSMSDIQIIEEHSVRRISVLQPTHSSTTKSNHTLDAASLGAPNPLPSISTSHTVIQPVLHSGATVIENYMSQTHSKSIPICVDSFSSRTTHMTTTTQPVLKSGSDLVNSRVPIEILPAYLPHLKRPQTKITIKGPIVFPELKKMCANGSNYEFNVDESSFELRSDTTAATTTCAFRQVASLPIDNISSDQMSDKSDETEEEIEVLDKDKENDKLLTRVSSPTNTVVWPKTTGAIRPRTLSLRTNNGSNMISSTLVSPDTPRPNKTCVQLYMNGHAYSRIGLKVTPRPIYCTIYKPQPMFVQQETDPTLSMYSNWTLSPLASEDIMNLAPPPVVLGLYDSRVKQRVDSMVMTSAGKTDLNSTHSSYWRFRKSDEEKESLNNMIEKLREDIGENVEEVYRKLSEEVSASSAYSGDRDRDSDSDGGGDVGPPKRVRIFEGGFKSNEDYTYVRGRGRGKYVCEECGIRCKKPSMLKKHIRTHTDLRPYSCRHCAFAFKTKGNLTKHMKSKAHHKKCVELGIIPVPITIDESQIDTDALAKQEMLEISCGNLPEDEDEDEDEGEWDEDEEEEDDEGVPIPLIELQRYEMLAKSGVPVVPGQFDDADIMMDVSNRAVSESGSAATEAEEQEAARSLLILSGSGSESDLTNALPGSRKTSNAVNEDIANSPAQEKRKVSVIDRRISQQVMEEQQRRVSAHVLEAEHHRRVSQHILEAEQTRRISQQMDQNLKQNESDFHSSKVMKPPTEPPLPLVVSHSHSPRKLSPIEQLQQQVQQQHQQLMQTTWTPNCDQLSRTRSYSFNDIPLVPTNPNLFASTSRIPIEPIEPISDESSDESLDSFAARRYSMSVIADRRFESQPKPPNGLSAIPEREEPMDLSLSSKPNEVMDGIIMPNITQSNAVPNAMPALRQGEFIPTAPQRMIIDPVDGKSICSICSKQFSKPSQLRLHINIHYFERPFRCDSCAVSFRTKGHLQKHKRSVSHFNKVNMNMTFGTPTTDNPRPFKCGDCKIAFRIHGHLAKHLRSKMHIMKLECLGKLPFGMYAEMERSGVNLNEIDTTDCENSLQSLQLMAQRLYDPRQMRWASEPIPETDEHFDEDSSIKNEPNDSFYQSLDRERPPLVANSQIQPLVAKPIQSDPPSPPQIAISPPIAQFVPPTVTIQQQSGFTSTRSNTCHLCGRLFKGAKFLQVHLYCDHSEDSPSHEMDERNDFECDICHKGFNDVSVLQQHMLSHTAVRPYVCDMCDAGFTSSPLLASHLQTHHPLAQQQTA